MRTGIFGWAAALALGVALASPAGAQQSRKLTVGFDGSYPPFASVGKDGKLMGFEVDLVNAICAEIKAQCDLQNVPYDGIFAALEAGKIDIIAAGLNINDERKQKYLMPGPYLKGPLAFVVPANASLKATLEGLKGKTVGTVGGSIFEKYMREKVGAGVSVQTYDSMDAAVLDLDAGRVAAVLGEEPQLLVSYVQAKPNAYKLAASITEPAYMGQGKGMVVRKTDAALADSMNKAIDAIVASGKQTELTTKWFGKAIPAR